MLTRVVARVSKASRAFEEVTEVELTSEPRFPVFEAAYDVLYLEFLAAGRKLVVALQPSNNHGALGLRQKARGVRKVLYDKERDSASHNRRQALEDEYPRPPRLPSYPIHIRDGRLVHTREVICHESLVPREIGLRTASRPPNAPDTEAAEKNMATRSPYSERLYQLHKENIRGVVSDQTKKAVGCVHTRRGSKQLPEKSRLPSCRASSASLCVG
jgi:hypothetical protein